MGKASKAPTTELAERAGDAAEKVVGQAQELGDRMLDFAGEAAHKAGEIASEWVGSAVDRTRQARKAAKRSAILEAVSEALPQGRKAAKKAAREALTTFKSQAAEAKAAAKSAGKKSACKKSAKPAESGQSAKRRHPIRFVLVLGTLVGGAIAVSKLLRAPTPPAPEARPAPTVPLRPAADQRTDPVADTNSQDASAMSQGAPSENATEQKAGDTK